MRDIDIHRTGQHQNKRNQPSLHRTLRYISLPLLLVESIASPSTRTTASQYTFHNGMFYPLASATSPLFHRIHSSLHPLVSVLVSNESSRLLTPPRHQQITKKHSPYSINVVTDASHSNHWVTSSEHVARTLL